MDTNIIFSDSISKHSSNFTRAFLQLSELDSNNEADGEEWEINPTEICLAVDATMAFDTLGESNTHQASETPRRREKGVNPWWPFRSKEVSFSILMPAWLFCLTEKFTNAACHWCACNWLYTVHHVAEYV
jgi:hypothetical protein